MSIRSAAKRLASAHYDERAAANDTTFLTSYPTKEQYVNEWWEERYAPIVVRTRSGGAK